MSVVAGAHATLANGRPAMALPVPVFHRRDHASFAWRTGSLGHAATLRFLSRSSNCALALSSSAARQGWIGVSEGLREVSLGNPDQAIPREGRVSLESAKTKDPPCATVRC
jgi:hypothetical protein